jgi:Arc/MetJ family transcription regulator
MPGGHASVSGTGESGRWAIVRRRARPASDAASRQRRRRRETELPLDAAYESAILICIRTTLNIDGQLLADAQRAAGVDSKTKVIELALRALIEQAARKRLSALHGALPKAAAPERRRTGRRSA